MALPPLYAVRAYHARTIEVLENGCWEWRGALCRWTLKSERNAEGKAHGYFVCRTRRGYRKFRAHRFAYWLYYGRDPGKKVVAHRCDNPQCVNPAHLYLATQRENVNDMLHKGRAPIAKLTPDRVREIRYWHRAGIPELPLSVIYDVGLATIVNIVNRKTWKDLADGPRVEI